MVDDSFVEFITDSIANGGGMAHACADHESPQLLTRAACFSLRGVTESMVFTIETRPRGLKLAAQFCNELLIYEPVL